MLAKGDSVSLRSYGGQIIERKVVSVANKTVYVCREDEYQRALRANVEPDCIGFPFSDVLSLGRPAHNDGE